MTNRLTPQMCTMSESGGGARAPPGYGPVAAGPDTGFFDGGRFWIRNLSSGFKNFLQLLKIF